MSRIIVGGATRIIQGVQEFQKRVFGQKESLFKRLGQGQWPLALMITCSDSRTPETDEGGRFIKARLAELGHVLAGSAIVPDEPARILEELQRARGAQVVLITGGTGLSSRDSTFEAISGVIARPLPGFGELFRMLSFQEIGTLYKVSERTLQRRWEKARIYLHRVIRADLPL